MGTPLSCAPAHQAFGFNGANCARAINQDLSCIITNDRMRFMTKPVPQAVFQPAAGPRDSCAGPSLLEQMWATLIDEMDALMPGGEYASEPEAEPHQDFPQEDKDAWHHERARIQGACQGIAVCIALVINPYRPNVDEVRTEAAMRWADKEAALGDDETEISLEEIEMPTHGDKGE